jgi:hypothetical protein
MGYCGLCLPRGKYRMGTTCHEGKMLCEAHFLVVSKGFVDCPGCLGKGWSHPNGKRDPRGKIKCSLCKGARVLEPIA